MGIEIYNGSAGAAKSYFITQKLIIRALNEPIKILVCRKYGTTIRKTCFSLFKRILKKWKLYPDFVQIRESDFHIQFPNGSEILFTGLDEETKLLSLDDITAAWVEEAYEVEKEIIEQINLRLRSDVPYNQLYLAFNPISKNHWLYKFCEEEPPDSFLYIHSTYKDNPFLQEEYRKALEEMKVKNPSKYRIFGEGKWGVDPEGLVITNWKEEEFDEYELAKTLEHRCGMDLGYIDKSAIIDTLYDRENNIIYVFNEFYKSGQQLSDLVNAIEQMELKKAKIRVDAAEPRTIQYLRNNGINAEGAKKGPDSVKAGIMFLQDALIIVHPRCKYFKTELENFSYIKSRQTGEYTEDTTHEWSHAIDACRYAYSDIYTNKQIKSISKAKLNL